MKTKTKVGLALLSVISSSILVASLIPLQKEKTPDDYVNCLSNKKTYNSPFKESDLLPDKEDRFIGIAFRKRINPEEAVGLLRKVGYSFEASPQDNLLFKIKVPRSTEVKFANKLNKCLFELSDYVYIGYYN